MYSKFAGKKADCFSDHDILLKLRNRDDLSHVKSFSLMPLQHLFDTSASFCIATQSGEKTSKEKGVNTKSAHRSLSCHNQLLFVYESKENLALQKRQNEKE